MKVLLIDNYDSFVFNLARYVAELGYAYEVIRNDELSANAALGQNPSHFILSPGPCTPNEAGITLELIRLARGKIPLLGVCLGHQAIAQAYGGEVVRAQWPKHGKEDFIFHNGQDMFYQLPNPLKIGRYHSLIVDPQSLPPELEVTATTQQGEIMAFQDKKAAVFGVQFHPESVLTEYGHRLLDYFLKIRPN